MACNKTPEAGCDFYSRSKFDLLDPFQHAHQCYLGSHADPTPVSSKNYLISSHEIGSYEHNEGIAGEHFKAEHSSDSSSGRLGAKPTVVQSNGWRPSFFRGGPLVGIAALLLAFLQVYASFLVLNRSNGRAVDSWKFKPSVYIAILTTFSNGAISFAVAQGAVITFWLRCLRGTSLAQLHRDWAVSSQVYNALRAGRHVSLLAIASVLTVLVCIDGPLLQRASSTTLAKANHHVNLNVSVVPEIPSYFTGTYDAAIGQGDFSDPMLSVMNEYSSQTPITSGIQGCVASCTAKIRAPALVPYRSSWNTRWHNFSASTFPYMFETYLSSIYGETETLDLLMSLTGDAVAKTCAGPINKTHYYLRSAIAEYDVLITNRTVTLTDPANPRFISWANNTAINNATIKQFKLREHASSPWIKTTLGGIVSTFGYQFQVMGWGVLTKSGIMNVKTDTRSWFLYQHATNYEKFENNKACALVFRDPLPAIMAGLNEVMFRVGVYAADNYNQSFLSTRLDPGLQTNYNVTGTLQSPVEVFKSDFAYFVAAAAIQQLTIVIVLSTFWGYWRLGRHVSFSPLEIAKAFGASLLAGVPSNSSGVQIAKLTREDDVQYGLAERYSKSANSRVCSKAGTLKISHRGQVHAPEGGNLCMC